MDAHFRTVMDGSDRSIPAAALRAAAGIAEPFYSGVMSLRNRLYDSKLLPIHRLDRPTISVGNITTGGTGKTPIVLWLAKNLPGEKPCVLLRGYKSTSAGVSDEQALFAAHGIFAVADRDRLRGAEAALREHPEATVFILDDAMQHRRIARDFDLVLIHAGERLNRVFPRGMLRESPGGLRRADAIVLTHADEADPAQLADTANIIRRFNPNIAIFHADHVIDHFRAAEGQPIPATALAGKPYLALCGIGSPASFFWRLKTLGEAPIATMAFPDHHDYSQRDLASVRKTAGEAQVIVTTEKDWVKLAPLASRFSIPIWRAELIIRFWPQHEQKLLGMIHQALANPKPQDGYPVASR